MKTKTLQLVVACCLIVLSNACLKDTAYRTYTYTLYRPVYKTTEEVRANIKNDVSHPITSTGKMYVIGKYIFLNDAGRGIHIINNSNPSNPVRESYINIPGCEDMAVTGSTLYAVCYTDLVTIDISDPKNVKLINTIPNIFPDRQYVLGYAVDSGRVIADWIIKDTTVTDEMPLGKQFGGIVYMDRKDAIPIASSASGGTKGKGGSMARFAIQSQHLYSVTSSTLNVLDITNAEAPQLKKVVDLGWGIETIYPFKDKLFIGSTTGMQIFSVADAENPEKTGTFEHVRVCDPVIADDDFAYVTLRSGNLCGGFTNQLDVVDVGNIYAPVHVKTYELENPHGLDKDGKWLFICDGDAGLKLFDATESTDILLKKTIDVTGTYDVICLNGIAILSAADGLYQYDYSDADNIKLLSKISLDDK